jgi:hypothetical protein
VSGLCGSRSSGQSAAAKFAYICREGRYADGKKTRVDKEELVHTESGNMPAWADKNPALYWQSADLYERANGRLFQQEPDRAAFKAEAVRTAEEAKLIEPATTTNAALVLIADRIEQRGTERVLVSRQEAAIFADAMAGVGLPGRLHGQGRGFNFLKNLEDGGRLPVGKTLRSDDFKGLANIEVSRTKTGFEYAITAIKDKVTEFVAYLRGAAATQLDWDTKVLKSRARQIEQPSQYRQHKDYPREK